jgi:hypothetical protein
MISSLRFVERVQDFLIQVVSHRERFDSHITLRVSSRHINLSRRCLPASTCDPRGLNGIGKDNDRKIRLSRVSVDRWDNRLRCSRLSPNQRVHVGKPAPDRFSYLPHLPRTYLPYNPGLQAKTLKAFPTSPPDRSHHQNPPSSERFLR